MAHWKTYAIAVVVLGSLVFFTAVLATTLNEATSTAQNNEDIIKRFCLQTNVRNRETKKQLNSIIARLPEGPAKERAKASRPGTFLLINTLAPVRDCDEVLAK